MLIFPHLKTIRTVRQETKQKPKGSPKSHLKQDKQSYKFGITTKIQIIINNHLNMIQEEFIVVEKLYDQLEHSVIRE